MQLLFFDWENNLPHLMKYAILIYVAEAFLIPGIQKSYLLYWEPGNKTSFYISPI